MLGISKRAIVADDQTFFKAGLSAMLENELGYTSVLTATHHADLRELLNEFQDVSLLVVSIDLPGSAGLATIQELRKKYPELRIAVLAGSAEVREVLAALAAGANGLISRHIEQTDELLHAIKTIDDAGIFVPASLISPGGGEMAAEPAPDNHLMAGLTDRQQQVIALVFTGQSNKMIARKLGISPSTVKVHVHAAFRTLGVHSRLGAMAALRPNSFAGAMLT
ncbi:response regulator transcription factor [Sphingomonas swuensis]|uniref:Response regulator transcription factor n=2 Tax=Sphingomonas swuensis TaxID=977800 RepID=A0ABP7T044_9SPHN